MFKRDARVQATIDGRVLSGRVTVSDTRYTQFIDSSDELGLRTIIARNIEDDVKCLPSPHGGAVANN